MGEGSVYRPVDWRHSTMVGLEGYRAVARFDTETVVDGPLARRDAALGVIAGVFVPVIVKDPTSGLLRTADGVLAIEVLDCRTEGRFYAG